MRTLFAVSALAVAISAQASLLYNNGPFVTGTGNGFGGGDTSAIETGFNTFGYGVQANLGNYVADNFTLATDATLNTLRVFSYQTGSGLTSTFTGGSFSIMSANPSGASPVTGNELAGSLASVNPVTSAWSGAYRVTAADLLGNTRPIFAIDIDLGGVSLAAGSYYIAWGLTGSLGSGPWAVPVVPNPSGANGRQFITANAAWGDLVSAGFPIQDAAFEVYGEPVPEPGTMLALGGAIAAFARRRRNNK